MVVIGNRIFHPRLAPTLVTLIMLPILVSLGFWQLDRAKEKRLLLAQFESQLARLPIDLNKATDFSRLQAYQKVSLIGRFDSYRQFLLDNKVYQGRVGYQVITPLHLQGSGDTVMVNRGWIPLGSSREDIPVIPVPQGNVVLQGQIKMDTGGAIHLGDPVSAKRTWPRVIQWIEPDLLQSQLGHPLLPFVILLEPQSDAGFVRDWYVKKIVPEKSTSYAVQWFALSLALVIIYVAVNTHKNVTEVKQDDVE